MAGLRTRRYRSGIPENVSAFAKVIKVGRQSKINRLSADRELAIRNAILEGKDLEEVLGSLQREEPTQPKSMRGRMVQGAGRMLTGGRVQDRDVPMGELERTLIGQKIKSQYPDRNLSETGIKRNIFRNIASTTEGEQTRVADEYTQQFPDKAKDIGAERKRLYFRRAVSRKNSYFNSLEYKDDKVKKNTFLILNQIKSVKDAEDLRKDYFRNKADFDKEYPGVDFLGIIKFFTGA